MIMCQAIQCTLLCIFYTAYEYKYSKNPRSVCMDCQCNIARLLNVALALHVTFFSKTLILTN